MKVSVAYYLLCYLGLELIGEILTEPYSIVIYGFIKMEALCEIKLILAKFHLGRKTGKMGHFNIFGMKCFNFLFWNDEFLNALKFVLYSQASIDLNRTRLRSMLSISKKSHPQALAVC